MYVRQAATKSECKAERLGLGLGIEFRSELGLWSGLGLFRVGAQYVSTPIEVYNELGLGLGLGLI